ncbi:hypothetical protein BDW59DRAFT_154280 [Aspergillus cavernicola]|uniref:Uncharacterized protein n=1 Tax=Aspergillus cavernicola TaxID=176166 RepID=A0ABR4HIJ4_9EURO
MNTALSLFKTCIDLNCLSFLLFLLFLLSSFSPSLLLSSPSFTPLTSHIPPANLQSTFSSNDDTKVSPDPRLSSVLAHRLPLSPCWEAAVTYRSRKRSPLYSNCS